MKNNKFIEILIILLITIFMIGVVPKYFQNDTFFTIAVGQRVMEYGIEVEDHLVWHEGLHFIHLRWAFDFVITFLYNAFGFGGIYIFVMIIGVFIALIYYSILKYITKKRILSFVATIITMYFVGNDFIAGRAQIISYLLFLLEFFSIEKLLETNKKRYFILLMIIPLLLVNFHASVFPVYFVMYMPYIAEYILSKMKLYNEEGKVIIEKRSIKKLLILMIISIFLGFCSPIGKDAYTYMFKVMSGSSTDFIAELQPIEIFKQPYFTIMCIIAISILMFTETKIRARDGFFIIGFIFMSIPTSRCLAYFCLISSISIFRIINDFFNLYNVEEIISKVNSKVKIIFEILGIVFVIIFSVNKFTSKLSTDYVKTSQYPVDIANYILENIDISKMKIYNGFNFGSYLEYRGIPAFMDSRSEMYTPEFNENCTILGDFYDLNYGLRSYNEIFEEYGITHALLENKEISKQYICYDNNWKLLYEDATFSLYEKVNN